MKKHWIYIKRGLSEDPKHRAQMGECIWLFMHIIDRADWETGIAYDWKDREEAIDMGMEFETLRNQRQKLERLDYIHCKQKQHGQDIKIMEWRNPREYDSQVRNPRNQGDLEATPSDFQGDIQGDLQGCNQKVTRTLDSISMSSLDWKLAHGQTVEQHDLDEAQIKSEAPRMFEKAFGTGTWPWDSNNVWRRFAKFVEEIYRADRLAFGKYVNWRAGAGKYAGMNNKQIRTNPQVFMDTGWIEFEKSQNPEDAVKYHQPIEPDPNEGKYVPPPNPKPKLIYQQAH